MLLLQRLLLRLAVVPVTSAVATNLRPRTHVQRRQTLQSDSPRFGGKEGGGLPRTLHVAALDRDLGKEEHGAVISSSRLGEKTPSMDDVVFSSSQYVSHLVPPQESALGRERRVVLDCVGKYEELHAKVVVLVHPQTDGCGVQNRKYNYRYRYSFPHPSRTPVEYIDMQIYKFIDIFFVSIFKTGFLYTASRHATELAGRGPARNFVNSGDGLLSAPPWAQVEY